MTLNLNFTKYFLALTLVFVLGSCLTKTNKTEDIKYNVLFIAIDDLKPLLGCYGDKAIKTPNIDALSKRGLLFTKAYCQQAVCGPSRASILTGMRPDYTGIWDLATKMRDVNPDILSMPQYFKENGYNTVAVGKVFDIRCVDKYNDAPSWTIPFSESKKLTFPKETGDPVRGYYASKESKRIVKELTAEAKQKELSGKELTNYISARFKPTTECGDVPDEAYPEGQFANNTLRYLRQFAKDDKPFFLAVGFRRPHLPFASPKKYWDLYKREDIELAKYQKAVKDGVDLAYTTFGEMRKYTDIPALKEHSDIFSDRLTEEKQRELIHGYRAAVSFVDAQVGKVLAELKTLGLDQNTIIVLWGDHGWHLGDHALWCKHTNFENATHVPFMFSIPGKNPGVYNNPVELVDVFPTLCEATGLEIPEQLQGKSLVSVVQDNTSKIKDYAVSQYRRGENMKTFGYSIRTNRYRLTLWMKDYYRLYEPFDESYIVGAELYDYKTDPLETQNFYNDVNYLDVKQKMMNYFHEFAKKQNIELKSTLANPNNIKG